MSEYIALSKAAARLKVSAAVAHWMDAGTLRGMRVPPSNARVILAKDLERLALKRHRQPQGTGGR